MRKTAILFIFCNLLANTLYGGQINFLDEQYYGFEDGGDAMYYQHPEVWSVTNENAGNGSTYSLKYFSTESITEFKKANIGFNEAALTIPAGTYTMRLQVWLDPQAEISGFHFIYKDTWTSTQWSLDTIRTGEWLTLEQEVIVSQDIVNSDCLFRISPDQVGKGLLYIDNLQLWGDETLLTGPQEQSTVFSKDLDLTLPSGLYDVNTNIWVEEGTSIKKCYMRIGDFLENLVWEFDTVETANWEKMTQEVLIRDTVQAGEVEFIVCNNPEFGGGSGTFYLDDVEFIRKSSYIPIEDISISDTLLVMQPEEEFKLGYTLDPENASNHDVQWISDNEDVVTAGADGTLHARQTGSVVVKVLSTENFMSAYCKIIVRIAVTGIELLHDTIEVKEGESYSMEYSLLPEDAGDTLVHWTSEDEAIAVVDSIGRLTGKKEGVTRIIATTNEGDFSESCVVKVLKPIGFENPLSKGSVLYPNPFSEYIYVYFGDRDYDEIRILDANGKVLHIINTKGASELMISEDIYDLEAGIYVLKLMGTKGIRTRLVLKK